MPSIVAAALISTACAHDGAPPPATLYTLSSSAEPATAAAGTIVSRALAVQVRDPAGAPAAGVRIRFRATDGASRMRDSIVASGSDGVAHGEAVLRPDAGAATFTALVSGQDGARVGLTIVTTAPPALFAAAPASVSPGDTVFLRGRGLAQIGAAPSALFGSARGDVIGIVGDSAARVVVPACAVAGPSTVRLVSASASTASVALSIVARPTLVLAVGQAALASADGGCLTLPGDGAQYLVIPEYPGLLAGNHAAQPFQLVVGPSTSTTSAVSTNATVPANVRASVREVVPVTVAARLDALLRDREVETAPLAERGVGAARGIALRALSVGSSRSFNVINDLCVPQAGGCGLGFGSVSATLRYLGEHVALYIDDAPISGTTLTNDELQRFGALFDRTLYQLDVDAFGSASDIDGNGHVIVLLTPSVNALTSAAQCASGGFVAGFFFSDDLTTRTSNSNHGEVFYTIAPDPTGSRSCAHSAETVKRLAPATFLHEFQHMISFNQHAIIRGGAAEEPWLNEGLSHIAEELGARYYEGLLPQRQPSAAGRSKSSSAQLFPDSASDFISSNVRNAFDFLSAPSANSLTDFNGYGSLEERGGVWLFLRWLADQKGESILSRLVQTSRIGTANVSDKAQEAFGALFNDFAIATYVDSLPGVARDKVAARYHFAPNRNLRMLFARVASAYPISPTALEPGGVVQGALVPGTFDYFSLTARTSGEAHVVRLLGPNGGTLAPVLGAQVGVLRIR